MYFYDVIPRYPACNTYVSGKMLTWWVLPANSLISSNCRESLMVGRESHGGSGHGSWYCLTPCMHGGRSGPAVTNGSWFVDFKSIVPCQTGIWVSWVLAMLISTPTYIQRNWNAFRQCSAEIHWRRFQVLDRRTWNSQELPFSQELGPRQDPGRKAQLQSAQSKCGKSHLKTE